MLLLLRLCRHFGGCLKRTFIVGPMDLKLLSFLA